MSPPGTDFAARIAATYDELRPLDAGLERLVDDVARAGDLHMRRLLDVGCGTGSITAALVDRCLCKAWGLDSSPEMIARARAKRVPGAHFTVGRAEELPFADGWFERALMRSVVHHVERPSAFADARRVLCAGGRLVIHNLDPDGLEDIWYVRFFPSLLELERRRIPDAAMLERELREAGFGPITVERLALEREFDRETALRKLHGRHTSSFDLLEEDEIRAGIERAERELPDRVRYVLRVLLVVAETARPS
jgi:ubiquinone/menaquinone biosynthesis C-methylase UbiE